MIFLFQVVESLWICVRIISFGLLCIFLGKRNYTMYSVCKFLVLKSFVFVKGHWDHTFEHSHRSLIILCMFWYRILDRISRSTRSAKPLRFCNNNFHHWCFMKCKPRDDRDRLGSRRFIRWWPWTMEMCIVWIDGEIQKL